MPGGGVRKPGVLSATWPGGQQSLGFSLKRTVGQQTTLVPGLMPISPPRIGIAHFCPAGAAFLLLTDVAAHKVLRAAAGLAAAT